MALAVTGTEKIWFLSASGIRATRTRPHASSDELLASINSNGPNPAVVRRGWKALRTCKQRS
jgi:hypothetical protein